MRGFLFAFYDLIVDYNIELLVRRDDRSVYFVAALACSFVWEDINHAALRMPIWTEFICAVTGKGRENIATLVAIVVNEDGYREVLGVAEGLKEDKTSWGGFFQWLRGRGVDGVKLIVGDNCRGMLGDVGTLFPETKYQRCTVYFYRHVFSATPRSKVKMVAKMLMALCTQEGKKAAREKGKPQWWRNSAP